MSYASICSGLSPAVYYRLSEPSGTVAADLSGNTRNGAYAGGVTLGQPGATSDGTTSVLLDGSTGRVTTTYNPFVVGSTITVAGWAYRRTNSSADSLWSGDGASNGPLLRFTSGNNIEFWPRIVSAVTWTNAASPGSWFHWALVYNDSTRVAELFINGISQGQQTEVAGSTLAGGAISGNFEIGARGSGGTDPFDGYLEDVAVWTRGLSAAEISALYYSGGGTVIGNPYSYQAMIQSEPDCLGYWPCNDASGSGAAVGVGKIPGTYQPLYSSLILSESGLISYWRLGETSGTTAGDLKGTNTGTYTGGFTLGAADAIVNDVDAAVALNGSTGFISVTDSPGLRLAGPLSMEAWVFVTDRVNYYMIVTKGANVGGAASDYEFTIVQTTGTLRFGTTNATAVSAGVVPLNQWNHVAVTWSGTGTAPQFYLNGASAGAGAVISTTPTQDASALFIGKRADGFFFKGSLDEVAIYNVVLNSTQISNHYAAGVQGLITKSRANLGSGPTNYTGKSVLVGTSGGISFGPANSIWSGGSLTVECLINSANLGYIINCLSGNTGWGLAVATISRFSMTIGTGGDLTTLTTAEPTGSTWNISGKIIHVIATWDDPSDTLSIYRNGVLDASVQVPGVSIAASAAPLQVGVTPLSGSVWTGNIQDIAVYRRAITADRALKHYNVAVGLAQPESMLPGAHVYVPNDYTVRGSVVYGPDGRAWTFDGLPMVTGDPTLQAVLRHSGVYTEA